MRFSIVAGTLAFGMLITAGSSLALVEAIGAVAGAVQQSADAATAYADQKTGLPVSSTTEEASYAAGSIAAPVANQVLAQTSSAAANAAGQVNAAYGLAASIAANALASANAIVAMELDGPLAYTMVVSYAISNAIFLKEQGEAMAISAANDVASDRQGFVEDPTSRPSEAAAFAVSYALERQAATSAFVNAIAEA